MILPFTANALSATTAKTIKGTEPTFKALSGENRLGFTVGGKFYSESSTNTATTGNIVSGTSKEFNASLTFNDFVVKTLTAGDFTVLNDYDDSDGDGARTTGTGAFTIGATTYKWLQANGTVIQPAAYGNMIGCGSGYAMPLTLEITLANVQVHSEYGDPRDSVLTPLKKTYQINSTTGICNAKPNQMSVSPNNSWLTVSGGWQSSTSTASATPDPANGGGYSADFDPAKGFKASASPDKFPTTGFPGAQFQLVMTGAQDDWTYSVSATPSGSVEVVNTAASGKQVGDVILLSKPTGLVKVTATLKSDTSVTHDYEFTPTTNGWFVPKGKVSGTGYGTYAQAVNVCGTATNLPKREDLTNSPRNTGLNNINWIPVTNYYTRAIGKGVFGEWGWTDSTRYPSSQWGGSSYWTQDVHMAGSYQFVVGSRNGDVGYYSTSLSTYVACRG